MEANWTKAIDFVLKWEGGYTHDPLDPGGETNFGISKKSYPDLDIKNLTKEQAVEIYKRDYWLATKCDTLPYPLDIIVFDTAVNMGRSRATILKDQTKSWVEYLMERIRVYVGLRVADLYLKGWMHRVLDLYDLVKKPPMEVVK